MPVPHAPTSTDETSQDVVPPTQARTTPSSPTAKRTTLNHLQALGTPPAATPEYLAHLSPPTPINIPKLESYLQDHPHQPFVHQLLSGLSEGFKIGHTGPRVPQEFPNLPSAKENPSVIDSNMLKEVSLGHTAGPCLSPPPFPNLQVYLTGAIPKKHSSEWQTIFHLSYPKHCLANVNAHIPPEDYSLQYIKVDNAIAILQDLGQNCFMSKLDIKAALRNILVHPSDWELLGMKWQGLYLFDMAFPFGLHSAPFLFNQFSSTLEWIIQNKLHIPKVIHILNDFFITAAPPRTHWTTTLCNVLHLFTELDIPFIPLPPWNSWVSS